MTIEDVALADFTRRLVKDSEESIDLVIQKRLGRTPILSPLLEENLVEYLLFMEDKYYGLTRIDVRRMVYQLASKNGTPNLFTNEVAGRVWLDHFLMRHKNDLALRKPMGTSYAGVQGFKREAVKEFFDILQAELEKQSFPPDGIYNVDKTVPKIVQLTAAERGSLLTLICCMSAAGSFIPPVRMQRQASQFKLR